MAAYSFVKAILLGILRGWEKSLDTAGYSQEALMFEQMGHALNTGGRSTMDTMMVIIERLLVTNRDMVVQVLITLFTGYDAAHEHLEDMVNQACTVELAMHRNIIQTNALSAYEGAILYLVGQGRLVRLPGVVERYVWSSQSISNYTPVDTELRPSKICQSCYELKTGPHYGDCPGALLINVLAEEEE